MHTHSSADDLNALYVYETKMSLLIQISQTRQGAERLLESRIITVLSQCDYLDARPEADQMFVGMLNLYLSRCTIEPTVLCRSEQPSPVRYPTISSTIRTYPPTHQRSVNDVGRFPPNRHFTGV